MVILRALVEMVVVPGARIFVVIDIRAGGACAVHPVHIIEVTGTCVIDRVAGSDKRRACGRAGQLIRENSSAGAIGIRGVPPAVGREGGTPSPLAVWIDLDIGDRTLGIEADIGGLHIGL